MCPMTRTPRRNLSQLRPVRPILVEMWLLGLMVVMLVIVVRVATTVGAVGLGMMAMDRSAALAARAGVVGVEEIGTVVAGTVVEEIGTEGEAASTGGRQLKFPIALLLSHLSVD